MRGRRKNVLPFDFLKVFSIGLLVVMLATSCAGCNDDSDKEELEKQVSELQKQVEQLQTTPTPSPTGTTMPSPTPKPTTPTPTDQPKSNMLLMVSINGGSFDMGDNASDSEDDERPVHRVSVDSFVMAKYEVSYGDWEKVRDWAKANGYSFDNAGDMGSGEPVDETHPVTTINWYDAVKWCNALSEMEGRTPCYYTSAAQTTVYRSGDKNIENNWVDWDANGYRLPTEAEWEYACRANTTTKYSFGNSVDGSDANYWDSGDSYDNGTTPVSYYPANGLGLHDMHGNVLEWCWDWHGSYSSGSQIDPRGPSAGSRRVLRGGCWRYDTVSLRSATRSSTAPFIEYNDYGFRPVHSSS